MNQGTTRLAALLLGATLIVVIAVTLIMVLLRPPAPGPTPTPSGSLPVLSPSASVEVTIGPSPEPSPSVGPEITPTPTPTPTDTPPPTPTPSPTPVPTPNAPERDVTFVNLGTDRSDEGEGSPRVITFDAAAQSGILIAVSDLVGGDRVRVCSWRGDFDHVAVRRCQNMRNDETMERRVNRAGSWSVSVLGRPGSAPSLSLDIIFFARNPILTLTDFRFDGIDVPANNGFTIELTARRAGNIGVSGSMHHFEGGTFNWQLDYTNLDTSVTESFSGGPTSSMANSYPVGAVTNWRVKLFNPDLYSGPTPVTLNATVSWP